ncbi:Crp/Fnr family transcriptional regulator [Croceicoccus sp. F390]|uniref:Crp/Fnr family transcriptional regulator n=1 Tax=Croceicoccus esteveae TaxID=3075597 RepID=A0ABU2ZMR2_9SPHN|nr:Crp/Fnr family transcriptional regulator [Croceicoccus sp. F390]MDT0576869.1 Crp/Fnr family transcriptional regulator [Croceicoccus sp. F390]
MAHQRSAPGGTCGAKRTYLKMQGDTNSSEATVAAVKRRDDNLFVQRMAPLLGLDGQAQARLASLCGSVQLLDADREFVHAHEPVEHVHILLEGWACRYKILADDRRQMTVLLLPGDICDLDRLYVAMGSRVVITLTACKIASVSRDMLRNFLDEQGASGKLAAIENAALEERIASLGGRTARKRIAHLFCELQQRLTRIGLARDNRYRLPLTQKQLGDLLGMTAVHVNRVLKELRAEGVVEKYRDELVILDPEVLRNIAGFTPAFLHLDGAASTFSPEALSASPQADGAAVRG